MNSFEKKTDKFTRRKIQGFGSGNFAECLEMLQKFKIRENDQFRKEKLINSQEGKFEVSDQEI